CITKIIKVGFTHFLKHYLLNACWKYHSDSGGQTKAVSSVDFSFLDSKPVKLKYDQMETDYPH
ncbi:hypothetical protein, partial [Culturomica massiliensis]|uniref:hypothetical protein n=1 Tax=Culturomica massiliensis TaxID=1841857 RepID=UPI00266675BE